MLPQDWKDKNVNTSLLMEKMGRKLGMRLPHITIPPFYIWSRGRRGGGGGEGAGSESNTKQNSKCGSGQELMWHAPPYLWHHVRHELLSPKTRLDCHHQNHVHKRDKGNHLLHWCPWLDANTNLRRGWREGVKGGEIEGKGRWWKRGGEGREEREGEVRGKNRGGEGGEKKRK